MNEYRVYFDNDMIVVKANTINEYVYEDCYTFLLDDKEVAIVPKDKILYIKNMI